MLQPTRDPPDIRFRHGKSGWVIFVKKQAKRGEKDQEQMRKRLENSLPWSLSRWLTKMLRKRK
jgi:hypothetical protein